MYRALERVGERNALRNCSKPNPTVCVLNNVQPPRLRPQLAVVRERRALPGMGRIRARRYGWKALVPAAGICFPQIGRAIGESAVGQRRVGPQPLAAAAQIADTGDLTPEIWEHRQRQRTVLCRHHFKAVEAAAAHHHVGHQHFLMHCWSMASDRLAIEQE